MLAVVISIVASTARTEAVAAALAEPVAQRVLALGRAETARGARADLDAGNARLIARRLPVFAQPPPDAPSFVVQRQAARAWALGDLPEPIAALVRDEVREGRRGAVTTSLDLPDRPAEPRDSVVTIVPDGSGDEATSRAPGGSSGSDSGSSPGSGDGSTSGPRPIPPAIPTRPPSPSVPRGVLPDLPLVPRLPLLGG